MPLNCYFVIKLINKTKRNGLKSHFCKTFSQDESAFWQIIVCIYAACLLHGVHGYLAFLFYNICCFLNKVREEHVQIINLMYSGFGPKLRAQSPPLRQHTKYAYTLFIIYKCEKRETTTAEESEHNQDKVRWRCRCLSSPDPENLIKVIRRTLRCSSSVFYIYVRKRTIYIQM